MQDKETRKDARSSVSTEGKITRKKALKKMGQYGKYAALASLGTYILLNPKKAQAQSPASPGEDFKVDEGIKLF